jgi:hypothetical protein
VSSPAFAGNVLAGAAQEVQAICPGGKVPLGGGFLVGPTGNAADPAQFRLIRSEPSGSAWVMTWQNQNFFDSNFLGVTVFATCATMTMAP